MGFGSIHLLRPYPPEIASLYVQVNGGDWMAIKGLVAYLRHPQNEIRANYVSLQPDAARDSLIREEFSSVAGSSL